MYKKNQHRLGKQIQVINEHGNGILIGNHALMRTKDMSFGWGENSSLQIEKKELKKKSYQRKTAMPKNLKNAASAHDSSSTRAFQPSTPHPASAVPPKQA